MHIGLWDVEVTKFSRQWTHRRRWGCQYLALATLYLQEDSWYSSLLEAESTTRAIERLEGLGKLKNRLPYRESKPQSSGLYHSASTNYTIACRHKIVLPKRNKEPLLLEITLTFSPTLPLQLSGSYAAFEIIICTSFLVRHIKLQHKIWFLP
jgi:hypothetical protein